MRINIIQHTPNERAGFIKTWANINEHDIYVYHPYCFNGVLPKMSETDMLVILGGPMSPNDSIDWIEKERELILQLMEKQIPIFGACFGAQQIAKAMGCEVKRANHKEVGWDTVYYKTDIIPGIPDSFNALHWHQDMFEIPVGAIPLFSTRLLENQGFLLGEKVIGLQFHLEPTAEDVREIVINDYNYPTENNSLKQTSDDILRAPFPNLNVMILFNLLDYITK